MIPQRSSIWWRSRLPRVRPRKGALETPSRTRWNVLAGRVSGTPRCRESPADAADGLVSLTRRCRGLLRKGGTSPLHPERCHLVRRARQRGAKPRCDGLFAGLRRRPRAGGASRPRSVRSGGAGSGPDDGEWAACGSSRVHGGIGTGAQVGSWTVVTVAPRAAKEAQSFEPDLLGQ